MKKVYIRCKMNLLFLLLIFYTSVSCVNSLKEVSLLAIDLSDLNSPSLLAQKSTHTSRIDRMKKNGTLPKANMKDVEKGPLASQQIDQSKGIQLYLPSKSTAIAGTLLVFTSFLVFMPTTIIGLGLLNTNQSNHLDPLPLLSNQTLVTPSSTGFLNSTIEQSDIVSLFYTENTAVNLSKPGFK